jgi:glycosyltransferase involved in cell wall biosynthesis
MSLVSIIIPCYNYGWLLSETLDSVLAQTHQQWECIIIDDGSVDNTRAVAENYGRRDARFRYVYQTNAGMSAARNRGLSMAQGDYIQFLDADDLLAAPKLATQVQVLVAHPEFDLVYGSVRYFRHEAPTILSRSFDMQDAEGHIVLHGQGAAIVTPLVKHNRMVINAPLLRAGLVRRVGPFLAGLRSMEDWEFWLRCALSGAYFHYDDRPETWAFVRVHPTSTSQNRPRMQLFEEQVRASLMEPLDKAGLSEAAALNKELLQQQRNHNAKQLLRIGKLRQGLGKYWQLARESGHYQLYLREAMYILRHRSV